MLWAGLLLPPFAMLTQMQVNYSLLRWACDGGYQLPLHLVSLAALVVTALSGWMAWRSWQRAGREWPGEEGGTLTRSRFMALVGLLTSTLFFVVIIAQWIPVFIFKPC